MTLPDSCTLHDGSIWFYSGARVGRFWIEKSEQNLIWINSFTGEHTRISGTFAAEELERRTGFHFPEKLSDL